MRRFVRIYACGHRGHRSDAGGAVVEWCEVCRRPVDVTVSGPPEAAKPAKRKRARR